MLAVIASSDAAPIGAELADSDIEVIAVTDAEMPGAAVADAVAGPEVATLLGALGRADLLVVDATRAALTARLVAACDRLSVRVVAVAGDGGGRRLAETYGVRVAAPGAVLSALDEPTPTVPASASDTGRIIAVWGTGGAPGRTTVAIELACELARDGRHIALADADSHAPSLALATGLADEGPGFAAACRQAGRGALTAAELTRISVPLGDVDVLTGLNRPGRWPELDRARVRAALEQCRSWADETVVDVASPLEQDEEIVSDLDGPRRNAATLAVLETADVIVAVVTADPVSISRFVRSYPDLRAVAGTAPIRVVVNKTRAGALGIDPRGQVRRALDRFIGVDDVWFVPWDQKSTDAALLSGAPIAHTSPRSALTSALRRFVGEAVMPPAAPSESSVGERAASRRGRRRGATAPRERVA